MNRQYRSVASAFAPLGTLFETLALVFSDAVISALMEAKKEGAPELKGRLTNMDKQPRGPPAPATGGNRSFFL